MTPAGSRSPVSTRLPDFPWDTLAAAKATARAYPGGFVDLSVGTPVDPTPQVVRDALAAGDWSTDAPDAPLLLPNSISIARAITEAWAEA